MTEWIFIPDSLVFEAKGPSWQEGAANSQEKPQDFHLRYCYSPQFNTLYIEVMHTDENGITDDIFQTGILSVSEEATSVVAAFEAAFEDSELRADNRFSKLISLLALYRNGYSEFGSKYVDKYTDHLAADFSTVFAASLYALKNPVQSAESLSGEFENVVAVDFRARKKAYTPGKDLLQKMRRAIADTNHDSPFALVTGPLQPK